MRSSKLLLPSFTLLLAGAASAAGPAPRKTPELIEKGRATYSIYCLTCHGPTGAGDGEAAATLLPKPRDFSAKLKHGSKPEEIVATLEKGIEGTAMVPFGQQLSEEERWAVTFWVLELRGQKARKK